MTNQRSFLPGDDAILVATADATGTLSRVRKLPVASDWKTELEAYNNERDIRALMMNRTGVCG
jgi:hypothetical protein